MRSTVNWTVLGLVIERPSYGYELWNRFERLHGDTLPISGASNVYGALNALRERGLIEEEPGRGGSSANRQPKPSYRATPEGLESYGAWVIAQAREHGRRSLWFARQLADIAQQPEIALSILERYEQACLDDKAAKIPTPREFPKLLVPGLEDRLASAYGRGVLAATLEWIEYARTELTALAREKRQPR